MCLAIPGKIHNIEELGGLRVGRVHFGGISRQTYLDFVPDAQPGDYVLVHVGFAISIIDETEALQTYQFLQTTGLVAEELGQEPATDEESA